MKSTQKAVMYIAITAFLRTFYKLELARRRPKNFGLFIQLSTYITVATKSNTVIFKSKYYELIVPVNIKMRPCIIIYEYLMKNIH